MLQVTVSEGLFVDDSIHRVGRRSGHVAFDVASVLYDVRLKSASDCCQAAAAKSSPVEENSLVRVPHRGFAKRSNPGHPPRSFAYESWLRITRAGDTFTGEASADGQQWSPLPQITLGGNDELQVGVLAINDTRIPFNPQFSELSLRPVAVNSNP